MKQHTQSSLCACSSLVCNGYTYFSSPRSCSPFTWGEWSRQRKWAKTKKFLSNSRISKLVLTVGGATKKRTLVDVTKVSQCQRMVQEWQDQKIPMYSAKTSLPHLLAHLLLTFALEPRLMVSMKFFFFFCLNEMSM